MRASKQLFLIGGSAGAGKSTVARAVARKLGCAWLQADTIWIAVRAALPPESPKRVALEIDRAVRDGVTSADALLAQHRQAAEILGPSLAAAIEFELLEAHDGLVVDGAWLLPSWVGQLRFEHVRADIRLSSSTRQTQPR